MINVYYVHTSNISESLNPRRPSWFSHDKCFDNLLDTIDAEQVKVIVSFDGDPFEFVEKFKHHRKWDSVEVVPVDLSEEPKQRFPRGLHNAFKVYDLIESSYLPDDDFVYVLENDYLHVHGWVDKLLELNDANIDFDYVSLYDHLDKYYHADRRKKQKGMYKDLESQIFVSASHHWRSTPSTCGSWITRAKTFAEDERVLRSYVDDFALFTKLCEDENRLLISAVPGLSTHCIKEYLSPTVDWSKALAAVNHESTSRYI